MPESSSSCGVLMEPKDGLGVREASYSSTLHSPVDRITSLLAFAVNDFPPEVKVTPVATRLFPYLVSRIFVAYD